MKQLIQGKSLARIALAFVLVFAVAVSLWFASPSQVQALTIDITDSSGNPLTSGTLGQTYNFKVTLNIEDPDLIPATGMGITITSSANPGLTAFLLNLPFANGSQVDFTDQQTGNGGTANVSVTQLNVETRQGTGNVSWKGYAYRYVTPAWGYGVVTQGQPAKITYAIAWTPPVSWPAGAYKITTGINTATGNPADNRMFTQESGEFQLQTGLLAETAIGQQLSGINPGVVVVEPYINRIKNPDGTTAIIPGGIGSYSATVSTPGGIQILAVNGIAPFNSPTFDPSTGVFGVANVVSPPQPNNSSVAEIVARLTGSNAASVTMTVTFQTIGAAGQPGLNVPEEHTNTYTFLRGNAKKDDATVDINDALFIAQYIVGQRTLDGIGALNAASVKQDGANGDVIDINDALFIAQYIVGQKNASYQ